MKEAGSCCPECVHTTIIQGGRRKRKLKIAHRRCRPGRRAQQSFASPLLLFFFFLFPFPFSLWSRLGPGDKRKPHRLQYPGYVHPGRMHPGHMHPGPASRTCIHSPIPTRIQPRIYPRRRVLGELRRVRSSRLSWPSTSRDKKCSRFWMIFFPLAPLQIFREIFFSARHGGGMGGVTMAAAAAAAAAAAMHAHRRRARGVLVAAVVYSFIFVGVVAAAAPAARVPCLRDESAGVGIARSFGFRPLALCACFRGRCSGAPD